MMKKQTIIQKHMNRMLRNITTGTKAIRYKKVKQSFQEFATYSAGIVERAKPLVPFNTLRRIKIY